ncbi:unnamed protein product, partial [Brachionus calyciflorus]
MNLNQTVNVSLLVDEPYILILSVAIILSIIFISSILLNIISLRSILNQKELTIINTLILNLALADLTYTLGIPFFIYQLFWHNWLLGKSGCQLFILFEFAGIIVGTFTICALSIERYFDVTKNIKKSIDKYSNKFKIFITFLYLFILWSLAITYIIPFVISIDLFHEGSTDVCNSKWSDKSLRYYFLIKFLTMFLVPFSIILWCSVKILIFLLKWKINSNCKSRSIFSMILNSSPNHEMCKQLIKIEHNEDRNNYQTLVCNISVRTKKIKISYLNSIRRKAICLVMLIVVVFLIQWSPLWVLQFLVLFSEDQFKNIQIMNMLSSTLSYSNTIANPLIYIICT